MKSTAITSILALAVCLGCKENKKQAEETVGNDPPLELEVQPNLVITPIEHTTAILE